MRGSKISYESDRLLTSGNTLLFFNNKSRVPVWIHRGCLRDKDMPLPLIFQPQLFEFYLAPRAGRGSNLRAVLIGNHDLPLYAISHPPLFYHKDGDSKIQAAYDA